MSLAYTEDSVWRNRDEFFEGREEIRAFLKRKWFREQDYRLYSPPCGVIGDGELALSTAKYGTLHKVARSRMGEGGIYRIHRKHDACRPSRLCRSG